MEATRRTRPAALRRKAATPSLTRLGVGGPATMSVSKAILPNGRVSIAIPSEFATGPPNSETIRTS
jgi:hypothetical protein